jgi:hypothetical protein
LCEKIARKQIGHDRIKRERCRKQLEPFQCMSREPTETVTGD